MPFPDGSGMSGDPFSGQVYTAEKGAGPQAPVPGTGPTPPITREGASGSADQSMFPPGLAPTPADASGLPGYLSNPSAFFPSPEGEGKVGEAPVSEAELASQLGILGAPPVPPAAAPPAMQLAEEGGHKLKCPKCDTVNAASAKKCKNCGHDLTDARKAKFAKLNASAQDEPVHSAIFYGTGIPLNLSAGADDAGLIWKVACKTGTLALSPGPGQIDLDVPLHLTADMFKDMQEAFEDQAFPYVTVPETHANGALENTGYVKALESLTKEQLLADARVTDAGKAHIADDPDDTEYLLTGIHFTSEDARQKADEGSIPDVSIGTKANYRHKRTGKTYKTALEHLSLTPIPWVDGLIPFNAAAALSQQPFDKDQPGLGEFDGVFTEVPRERPGVVHMTAQQPQDKREEMLRWTNAMNLGMSISLRGSTWDDINIDLAKAVAALNALSNGDRLDLPYGACIKAIEDKGETRYMVEKGYDGDTEIADTPSDAITTAVTVMQERWAREQADKARYAQVEHAAPSYAYSANPTTATSLDLAVFEPQAHPRDFRGKFTEALGGLKPGESASLPDGVKATRHDFSIEVNGKHHADFGEAADDALRQSTSAGPAGELPKKLGTPKAKKPGTPEKPNLTEMERVRPPGEGQSGSKRTKKRFEVEVGGEKVGEIRHVQHLHREGGAYTTGWTNAGSEWVYYEGGDFPKQVSGISGANKTEVTKKVAEHLKSKGGSQKPDNISDSAWDKMTPEEKATWLRTHKNIGKKSGQPFTAVIPGRGTGSLSAQDPTQEGAPNLSPSGEPASLTLSNPETSQMPEETIPSSVEELLAQQQAQIEALQTSLESTTTQLSAAQTTITSQGGSLHRDEVTKKVQALQRSGVSPALCLAAQQIWLGDSPSRQADENGLNLSVQVAKEGTTEAEERKLQSPTEIVDFLLSAVPRAETTDAARMAAIQEGIGDHALSQHTAANGSMESREANAKAAVDEWERGKYPERFDDKGERKPVAA